MTLLKRALSLTLLATSIYAAPYVNLTYVPGEIGDLQSACIMRKFRQLLLAPYYRMKLAAVLALDLHPQPAGAELCIGSQERATHRSQTAC